MNQAQAAVYGLPSGFYVPPEDARHERTFMQWPVNRAVHSDQWFLEDLQSTIADIANAIASFEPVVVLMPEAAIKAARKKLSDTVEIWDIPTDDLWARDSGPLFAVNGTGDLAISNLNFNGWGNKQVHPHDGRVALRVAERLGIPIYNSGVSGEPGGVEWDGHGTLIAHESSWVNPNRNTLSRSEIEARLLAAYGADKMIWAPGVTGHDITDDHIDALARYTAPGHVVIQVPYPEDRDVFSKSARQTLAILKTATDAKGRRLEITEIPSPVRPRISSEDFLASYANFYVCNGAVICSEFGDRDTDETARSAFARLFPGREIIALNVDALGEIGGGIHCATQQQPAT
ncbi:porphyromonas-type peptidyl-arginine deiminase [Roseibium aquae]|uniref:Porphyromonas-type peptidyl-arginine deiminase n=1 Tax=Roseibium aquae TaxID=1323746 RepID=A0A916TGZ0_9HYPH|nr:agmatine deiminase family protein [Roseibium aquae]GGB44291.1 porphyromonas-type peptidyl-arginine deiminase [Roseibium aquae]